MCLFCSLSKIGGRPTPPVGAQNRAFCQVGVLTGQNGFLGWLLTFGAMSSQSCVQMLQNTAFGSILACVSWRLAFFPPKKNAKESEKNTHYFYTAKSLKMAIVAPPRMHRFRVKTPIWQMAPVSHIYPPQESDLWAVSPRHTMTLAGEATATVRLRLHLRASLWMMIDSCRGKLCQHTNSTWKQASCEDTWMCQQREKKEKEKKAKEKIPKKKEKERNININMYIYIFIYSLVSIYIYTHTYIYLYVYVYREKGKKEGTYIYIYI